MNFLKQLKTVGVGNEALQVEQTYFPLELEFVDDPDPDDELEQDLVDELLMLDDLEAF